MSPRVIPVTGAVGTGGTAYEVSVSYQRKGVTGGRRILGPVTTSGTALDFGAVTGPTRPDDNATNSADPNSAFGTGTVAMALATLEQIEPITLDVSDIKKANVDQDAIIRQADRDRAQLVAAQIAGLLDQQVTRITLRDAGVITDPDTGKVYIYAVEQNAERVSKVEIGLDATTNQIALRATYDDVATMITQAQLSPGDAAEFGELVRRVNAAEISISGMTAAIALKADAITVTQLGGIVQSVSQNLDALAGIVTTKVSYSDFNPVRDRIGSVEQLLQSYGDVSTYQLTLRQAELRNTAAAVAGIAGLVTNTDTAQRLIVRSADRVNATAITQVTARIGDFGLVSVQQAFSVLADRTGKLEGQYTLAISTDGRLQGFKLAGSASGPATFSFIDTDLNMGLGRVIYNTGVVMQVQGIGFGRDGDLLEWFGPSMPVNSCTRANATSYKTTSGSEYMGGSLSAGFRTNAVRATMIAANADVTTGPFESAGRPRTVTVSLLFSTNASTTGTCPAGPVTPSVTVELYRGTSAAGVILSSRTIVGGYSCEPGRPNDPGSIVEQISGSFTYTDNSGGNTSSYYVRLTNRTTNTTPDQQVLSLLSVEE